MKQIKLTKGNYALVDDEDSGWLNEWRWILGAKNYAFSYDKGHMVTMHRLIMDAPKGMIVDHINHNTLDNRRENLRLATQAQNARNRIIKNNKTGFKGVSKISKRNGYQAEIKLNGEKIYLGYFKTAELAHEAYKEASIKHHGEWGHF